MKFKTVFLFCFLAISSTMLSAQENKVDNSTLTHVIISIEGMACQEGCADKIAANLQETEGVKIAKVSYDSGKANVTFNTKMLSIEDLKKIISSTKVKAYVYTIKEVLVNNKM